MLFKTEKDRSSAMLGEWQSPTNAGQPRELDNWVIWELVPGIFEVGEDAFRNLFDALPQTATYAQKDGNRMYSLSTILSKTYNSTKTDGGIKAQGWFGTPPSPGPFDCNAKPVWHTSKCLLEGTPGQEAQAIAARRLRSQAIVDPQASPNIHIMRMRGRTIGMSGAGGWTEIVRDISTGAVSTVGTPTFDDDLEDTLLKTCNHSPHTIFDDEVKEHVGVSLCVGILPHTPLTPTVKIWTMSEDPASTKGPEVLKRKLLVKIPTDKLFDLHSFGLTEKHLIYVETSPEFQSAVLIAHALRGDLQMLQTLCDWQNSDANPPAHVVAVDRATGAHSRFVVEGPVGKIEHFVGAYEVAGQGTVVDFLSEAPGNGAAFPVGTELTRILYHTNETAALLNQHLIRCVVPTSGSLGQRTSSPQKVSCRDVAKGVHFGPFVTMNPNFYRKPYRFAYLTFPNKSEALGLSDGVVKFDLQEERIVASSYSSFPAGRYVVNEPRFIPREGSQAEDDALLVVSMHDTVKDRSHQAVFDTKDLSLLGTFDFGDPAGAVGRVRVAFHGMHCPVEGSGPCLRL